LVEMQKTAIAFLQAVLKRNEPFQPVEILGNVERHT